MTEFSRSLQDLFRRHPLPWRLSAFTYYDMNDRAVSLDLCADIFAEHGYDIVSLVEQCVEYGAPSELADFAADAEGRESKALDRAYEAEDERDDLKRELEDAEREIDRLKDHAADLEHERDTLARQVSDLQSTVEDLQDTIKDLQAEVESLERYASRHD